MRFHYSALLISFTHSIRWRRARTHLWNVQNGSCNWLSWCATCILCTTSASGCKICGASPTRHGEGACAPGGAAPLSPPRILLPLLHHLQRDTHIREKREKNTPHNTSRNTHTTRHNTFACKPCKSCTKPRKLRKTHKISPKMPQNGSYMAQNSRIWEKSRPSARKSQKSAKMDWVSLDYTCITFKRSVKSS